MERESSSLKDLILNDSVLLYSLFGIILSAIYGVILSQILNVPVHNIHDASPTLKLFITVLEQKEIGDFIRWLFPFGIMCISILFLFIQHYLLENMLVNLYTSIKQGGLLKLFFFSVAPWYGSIILSLLASIWLPITFHAWSAAFLISLIIMSIFFGVIMIMICRMQSLLYGLGFVALNVVFWLIMTFDYFSLYGGKV